MADKKDFPLSISIRTVDQGAIAGLRRFQDQVDKTGRSLKRVQEDTRAWQRRMDAVQHGMRMQGGRNALTRIQDQIDARRGRMGFRGFMTADRGSLGGVMGGLTPFGMNPLALGGVLSAGAGVAAGRDALDFDRQLTRLEINSKGAMGSMDRVRDSILAVSKATGIAKEELLEGASSFVALTGDGAAANRMLETFAHVRLATDAATGDIAGTAAAMSQQLGIVPEQMLKAFSVVHAGANAGSVEFSDMASLMASLSASFKGMGKSQGIEGLAALSAMFQVAVQDFGGKADQGATGMERLMDAFSSPRTMKAAEELGINLFDKMADGSVRVKPMMELLDALKEAGVAKDSRLLNQLFESSEARRAARAILNNLDAVKKLSAETLNAKDITVDLARVQRSASHRAVRSWNQVKVSIAEAFTPERLEAFASMLEDILDTASRIPGFIRDIISIDTDVDRSEANAEVDRRLRAGETLAQIAADRHGGQMGNVRRAAQSRLLVQQADETLERSRAASRAVAAEVEAIKAARATGLNDVILEMRRMFPGMAPARETDRAHVKIEIAGAPRGTRATVDPRSTANVEVSTGYQMAPP